MEFLFQCSLYATARRKYGTLTHPSLVVSVQFEFVSYRCLLLLGSFLLQCGDSQIVWILSVKRWMRVRTSVVTCTYIYRSCIFRILYDKWEPSVRPQNVIFASKNTLTTLEVAFEMAWAINKLKKNRMLYRLIGNKYVDWSK